MYTNPEYILENHGNLNEEFGEVLKGLIRTSERRSRTCRGTSGYETLRENQILPSMYSMEPTKNVEILRNRIWIWKEKNSFWTKYLHSQNDFISYIPIYFIFNSLSYNLHNTVT